LLVVGGSDARMNCECCAAWSGSVGARTTIPWEVHEFKVVTVLYFFRINTTVQ
jgi:hypothetical protein